MPEGVVAPRVLVIVPAWNEEESLPGVLAELAATMPDADVLVVDDGSTDGTRRVAARAGTPVLVLPYNVGVGGAMRAGFRYADRHEYDVAAQIDGDGQHDPVYLARAIEALTAQDADVVIGSRFAGEGDYVVRGPRWWAMRVLARSLSRRTGTRLTDVTSGMRVASRRAIRLFALHYPAEYLGDTVESLVIAARAGLRVAEVPVAMRARQGGRPSHSPVKSSIYLFRALLALGLAYIRRWPSVEVGEDERATGSGPVQLAQRRAS